MSEPKTAPPVDARDTCPERPEYDSHEPLANGTCRWCHARLRLARPVPSAQLEELLTGIRQRRVDLAPHDCAGFGCATCEPSRDMEELDHAIAMVTGVTSGLIT